MDLAALGEAALTRHDAWAPLLVFSAGVLSSVGPCVAPRFVAVSAIAGASARPALVVAAFIGGLVAAYAAIGAALVAIADVVEIAAWVYGAVAIALVVGGLWTVARAHAHTDTCEHAPQAPPGRTTLARTALLGASFAFVVSPCCTPIVLAVVAATTTWGGPLHGAELLAFFGLGHSLPLVVSGVAGARIAAWAARRRLDQAVAIASGTMMFALGLYYAALA